MPIIGTIPAKWLRAVPPQTVGRVIRYLADSFAELRRLHPVQHAFNQNEPTLTISLSQHADLQDRKEVRGISGGFVAEGLAPVRDASGAVRKNGRTDILFTLGDIGAPQVVFEFKKLNGKPEHRKAYFAHGLARFIEGKYAPDRGQGVMVGLTRRPTGVETAALLADMASPQFVASYGCVPSPSGGAAHVPSLIAPGAADFDTVHQRPPSAGISPFTVTHVMFDCP